MLKIKNISKKFGKIEVLNNINLEIKKGEIVSLLGESGSGKSTVLNIIAGFEEVDQGSIIYKDRVLIDDAVFIEPQDRNIGFVFQNYALFPHLNVAKNISFGISNKEKYFQNKTVNELLELIDMKDTKAKYPHELSGGQQQRVAIARVLARQSELILFDEVFSSIDTIIKQKLIKQIKDIIKTQNKTAIFVTHDPKEAMFLSDRIAYIEDGKIVQFDTVENLCENPISKSVEEVFLGKDKY